MSKFIKVLAFMMAIIMMFSVVVFAEETATTEEESSEINAELYSDLENKVVNATAKVIEASSITETKNGDIVDKTQTIKLEIISGDYIQESVETVYNLAYDLNGKIEGYELDEGDKVSVQITENQDGTISATITDVNRSHIVIWLFILFVIAIGAIGGRNGIKNIVSILLTVVIIYFVLIKSLLAGHSVIGYALLASLFIIVESFIINFGFNKKVITASLGSILGVMLAGFICLFFSHLSKMSGASEEAILLSSNMTDIAFNFKDLLFGGVVIASLGAIMDVALSIAQKLDDLKKVTPEITWEDLFINGMKYGRESMASITNTLLLAYIGCSLTLILLFMACDLKFMEIINKETIVEQIVPALSGSIAIILVVPITSILYAFINKEQVIYRKTSENKVNGKRSLKI